MRRYSLRRRAVIGIGSLAMFAMGPIMAGLHATASPSFAARNAAADPAKVPLGSVNVSATATGIRSPLYSHQGEDVEAEVPYAVSQLGAGGTAHALTTIVWPGSTGAAGGSTLGVLGIKGLPTSLENALNDPYKAEAPSTSGKDTVSLNSGIVTMQAIAKATHVTATSALGPATTKTLAQVFGSVSATTNINQQADRVIVDAKSAIANISLGGVLSIGSIVSTAHAVSNGTHSTGTTTTQLLGLKVAGINVTLDQNGLAVSGKGVLPKSLLTTLTKTVNSALKAAGIRIFLTQSTKTLDGAGIHLNSGDVIISITTPGIVSSLNDTGILLELGGASVNASASPGYVPPVTPISPPPTSPTTATTPPAVSSGTGAPPVDSGLPPVTATTSEPPAPSPEVAATPLSWSSGVGVGWVVVGLILAGLFAFGMKRLPDRVLAATGPGCHLEEGS